MVVDHNENKININFGDVIPLGNEEDKNPEEIIKAFEEKLNLVGSMTSVYLDEDDGLELYEVMDDALALINSLKTENDNYSHNTKKLTAENMKLQATIDSLSNNILFATVEKIKTKAIKEFCERLEEDCLDFPLEDNDSVMFVDVVSYRNLLKELTQNHDIAEQKG